MTGVSSSQFSSGLSKAASLRARLLGALGAEPEWTVGTQDSPDNVWLAGPVPTFLSVQPAGALTPGLAVLTVRTRCAVVEDLDRARNAVENLNLRSTLNRWVVLGDPGPEDWFGSLVDDQSPHHGQAEDSEARRRSLISVRPRPQAPVSVELAVSFVVGDASTEVPFEAVVLAVSEQISTATSAVTNNFAQVWGEPALADLDGRRRSGDQRHPVVHHQGDRVAPFSSADTAPLLSALHQAFEAEQAEQGAHSTSAWFGSLDEARFTCEIPYGPGPFDEGVIGMNGYRKIPTTDENSTSLVEARPESSPQAGNGLLVTMQTPVQHSLGDPLWWQVSMLNGQSRLNGAGGSAAGTAHGFGAWVIRDALPEHMLFVPASWAHDLTPETLVLFFRQVLANLARLSWAARRVLEPHADCEIAALRQPDAIASSGLAAGPHARGLQFGEPAVGTDAGAEVLAYAWQNLVGPDTRWAQLFAGAGFDFWPHDHVQRITTRACSCADAGSCVTIDTPLLWGSGPGIQLTAMQIQAQGWPAALISDGQGLIARTVVHVHDDTLEWARRWPVALAVCQALLAEHADRQRGDAVSWTSEHPDSGRRPDRDQMLTLYDPGPGRSTPPAWTLGPEALALAATFCDYAPYALGWHGGSVLMDWSVDIGFQDGSSRTSTVRTTYGPFEHPALGRCLRISTDLQVDVPDPGAWCLDKNETLSAELLDTFILGGLASTEGGDVTYTSVVPPGLDQSGTTDLHAVFIGTSLNHHVSAVARLLLNLDTVGAPELTQAVLAERYGGLADFYRESGLGIPAGLSSTLTEGDANTSAALTVFRPGSLPQVSEWPLMGTFDHEGGPTGIRTVVPLDTMPLWIASRLVHASILGSAMARADGAASSPPLSTVGFPLSDNEIHSLLGSLIQDEVLCFDADQGELLVSPIESGIVLTAGYLPDHPGWGSVLTITAVCPAAGEGEPAAPPHETDGGSLQIGDWHRAGGRLRYRVCLPPQTFGTPHLAVRAYLFEHAVRSVAEQAKRYIGQALPC